MADRFTLEEVLDRNPRIDREKLEESMAVLRHLREDGLARKGYDLVPPHGGRRVSAQDDARSEPRRIRSRRSRMPK